MSISLFALRRGGPRALFIVLFFLVVACNKVSSEPSVILQSPDGKQKVSVRVEIADDNQERARGLMHREHLDTDAGMLFVFDQPQQLSFWMKNTLIPLDILYFDVEGNLVSSVTMTPCAADPCRGYSSGGAARYALEVNEGFVKAHGIGNGWTLVR